MQQDHEEKAPEPAPETTEQPEPKPLIVEPKLSEITEGEPAETSTATPTPEPGK